MAYLKLGFTVRHFGKTSASATTLLKAIPTNKTPT